MSAPFIIEAGDSVQARKVAGRDVAVAEFTVTAVTDGIASGSPLGDLDPADGWTFELTRKGDPGLPGTLSDLAVWTIQERTDPTRIVGPVAGEWLTPKGEHVDPADILAWMPWDEYTETVD